MSGGRRSAIGGRRNGVRRSLEVLGPVEAKIKRRSASLGKQLSEAAKSISLNLGEGRRPHDGDRRRHDEMAAGSTSECTTALRVARIRGYITDADHSKADAVLDRLRGLMFGLTRR